MTPRSADSARSFARGEPPRLLIVKTGTALSAVRRLRGDYDDWIRQGLGLPKDRVEVVSPYAGQALPEPGAVSAVVVTGSSAMVTERTDWSERTATWLRRAVEAGVPTLGICYGHQLLAHALGGSVGSNPRGREIGTIEVRFEGTEKDPLLGPLPEVATVQATHVESVLELPLGTRSLASSALDSNHAFAVGRNAWGVQFHPEFDADIMRGYLAGRAAALVDEGLDPVELIASTRDDPFGTNLLRRFAEVAMEKPD